MRWTEFIVTLGQSLSNPAFWVGFVLVIIFAYSRFSVNEADSERDDPRLKPRSFTTRFRYSLSALAYIGVFEFSYGLLVGIGSLPFLRDMLNLWIGSLQIPTDGAAEIGTPAWAALFATTVLPVAPGFRDFDTFVRKKLHNFASIPSKARGLALEIIDHLTPRFLGISETADTDQAPGDALEAKQKAAQLQWLFEAIGKLQNLTVNAAGAEDYKKFFEEDYRGIWNEAKEKMSQLGESLNSPDAVASVVIPERDALLNKVGRFLSCALLQNESSERDVRDVIRSKLGIDGFPPLPFDFSLKQIVLNVILVLMLTLFGSLITLGIAHPEGWDGVTIPVVGIVLFWLPFIAITMAVPFVFAAGVQLYIMDRQQVERSSVPFEDKLIALLFLLVTTFAVGLFPSLLAMVAGDYELSKDWIMQVVPSGLTPAVVALMFYFLSSRHLFGSAWIEAILDLLLFSSIAGFCSWLAAMTAFHAGMNVEIMMKVPGLTNEVVAIVSPVTHALMVGVVGAIQCSISRSNLDFIRDKKKPVANETADGAPERQPVKSGQGRSRGDARLEPIAAKPVGNLSLSIEEN